ncbi:MAG: polymer-forming cytoskeletal protein [Candidatus Methylomirabilales bacterium]
MLKRTTPEKRGPSEPSTDGGSAVPSTTLLAVTGNGAKLEGKLDIADSIEIECEVGGELKVGGRLVIGERGSVRADVETVDAMIHGEYEGNMTATGSVEITPTGRVEGNIKTNSLVISRGGFFNGNVAKLKESEVEADKTPIHLVREKQAAKEG